MAEVTLELSEHVIDAIADAVVKKMQKPCSCEYYDAENKTCRRSEVPKEPCEDCISRDAVQNYVESHIQEINTGYGDLNNHTNRILRMIVDGIRNLPSIQPKPKTDIEAEE